MKAKREGLNYVHVTYVPLTARVSMMGPSTVAVRRTQVKCT